MILTPKIAQAVSARTAKTELIALPLAMVVLQYASYLPWHNNDRVEKVEIIGIVEDAFTQLN